MDLFGGFLGNDSSFGKLMTKVGSIIAVNVLFVLSCIPFVTVGAAFAAMYSAIFEMLDAEDPINPFQAYWRGFRSSFVRATLSWLAFAAIFILGLANLTICAHWGGFLSYISPGVIAVMMAAVVVIVYLLPVLTRFTGRPSELIKLSVCIAVSNPLQLLLILFINIGPLVLLYLDEVNRPTYAFVGTFFWFGLTAYVIGKRLLSQFEPYLSIQEAD